MSKLTTSALIPFLSIMLAAGALGCRSDGDDDDDDDDDDVTDGGTAGDYTIQQVQDGSMPIGTAVTLRGVVVVAIDNFGDRHGNMIVMEPGGGPFSGVVVFLPGSQAADFEVGDLVDVEGGQKDEFAIAADTSGRTITEVEARDNGEIVITKVGNGTVPDPEVLDPRVLAADADAPEDENENEQWESVLVRFDNVAVTSGPRTIDEPEDENYDPTFKEMRVTGPYPVQSALTDLDDATFARGYCVTSMVGVIDYFFDYKLQPRTAADLGAEGDGCPAEEEGDIDCADEMDNDFDGFADCEDFSCQGTASECAGDDYTIPEIQDDALPVGTLVTVRGVVIVANDAFGVRADNLYVMDPAGGEFSGIVLYLPNDEGDAFAVGDLVDIQGVQKDEFALEEDTSGRTITQLEAAGGPVTITKVGDGVVPAPVVLDPRVLAADDTESERWESVLVQFENVAVTDDLDLIDDDGDPTFQEMRVTGPYRVQSALTALDDTTHVLDYCFASLTGVVDYFFSYKIQPRTAADLGVEGDGCPAPEATSELCGDKEDNDADGFVDCADFGCDAFCP
jgi:hypothetical protein